MSTREYSPKKKVCDTCGENHCRAREPIHEKRAFPIPNHIEGDDKYRYIRILQKKAEDTGKCNQYCDVLMCSPDFHVHRRRINASPYK